jgi:hypothetical protein
MKKLLLSLLILPSLTWAQSKFVAPTIAVNQDFIINTSMQARCTSLPGKASKLKNNQERQAFVICKDIALMQQVITWGERLFNQKKARDDDFFGESFETILRKEVSYVRDELKSVRLVLEQLKLAPNDGLMLKPSEWEWDLNTDGEIKPWEKYMFAIVKPGERAFTMNMPSNDTEYYQQHFQLDAKFRIDQSDVYWALAYHQFFEGLLETALAYTLERSKSNMGLKLINPQGLQRAHTLIGNGFATSEKMHASLLAETDDQDEWIANPKQKNTVFPLVMDQASFDLWGQFISEIRPLWAGKTLLRVRANAGGVLGSAAKMCPNEQGLNIAHLFLKPAPYLRDLAGLQKSCQSISAAHPETGLVTMLEAALARGQANPKSPEMHFVRYLYWVN